MFDYHVFIPALSEYNQPPRQLVAGALLPPCQYFTIYINIRNLTKLYVIIEWREASESIKEVFMNKEI